MARCNTCHLPRCGYASCNASKTPCPTCQETNTLTPATPGTGSNRRRAEMEVEDTDPQTDPNIRFQVVVRGWSNENQQTRAETLLALSDGKMTKSLQQHQDILLIPRDWWPALRDTLGPEEPGWWYTVSDEMWYQGCRWYNNRWDKDHQDEKRCPRCPAKLSKRKNSGSKKTQGKSQKGLTERTNDRPPRSRPTHDYAEYSEDSNMEEDSAEDSAEDSGKMQQGYLCTSADPRRVGAEGGETTILNSRDLRKAITLQRTTKDQTIWMTTEQTGFPLERDEDEITNNKDAQMGRTTARHLRHRLGKRMVTQVRDRNLGSTHRALTTTSNLESRPTSTDGKPPTSDHGL